MTSYFEGVTVSKLETTKNKIEKVTDPSLRKRYEDALKKSYIWDGIGEDRQPVSAHDIVAVSGIGASSLQDTGVLLGKKEVAEYGKELGANITETTIKKKLTKKSYERHFKDDREAVREGSKILITFAEARSFLGIRNKGEL